MKRILCLACALLLAFAMIPAASAAGHVPKEDINATVEAQIRAYLSSINQSNAADTASKALAKHGLTQGGKKLSAGKSHSLTAVLFNSNMLQDALVRSCCLAIRTMQRVDPTETWYIGGTCSWYDDGTSYYNLLRTRVPEYKTATTDMTLASADPYTGQRNSYDSALDWMVGACKVYTQIDWVKTTASEIQYTVTIRVTDKFDFTTSTNSGFKNLISGLGAVLFREFDWESSISFNITVPYSCTHTTGTYGWTYDSGSNALVSLTGDSFTANTATRYSFKDDDGDTKYYYQLDNSVELRHDRPWVLEYDVTGPRTTTLAPHWYTSTIEECLWSGTSKYVAFQQRSRVYVTDAFVKEHGLQNNIQREDSYYGVHFKKLITYSSKKPYTFRLENQINSDGSNMILLTILDGKTGSTLVDRVPMDTSYYRTSWAGAAVSNSTAENWVDAEGWISGRDFYFNYIGNKTWPFSESKYTLRIWEHGKDIPSQSSCAEKVTAPTCTAKGYTTYQCLSCGYSYKGNYTPADHSWSEWTFVSPTLNQRRCTACGETEEEQVDILWGDCNGDGTVNALDLIVLRQHLADWDVAVTHAADCNADSAVNAKDLIHLRQSLAGWDATFGS